MNTSLTLGVSSMALRIGGFAATILQMVAGKIHRVSSDAPAAAARDKWATALRTRRLASALPRGRDWETLMTYAEELEREAAALERQAAAPQQ
jgi:hypothetical protein